MTAPAPTSALARHACIGEREVQHGTPRLRAAAVEVSNHLEAVRVGTAFAAYVPLLRKVHLAGAAARFANARDFSLQLKVRTKFR